MAGTPLAMPSTVQHQRVIMPLVGRRKRPRGDAVDCSRRSLRGEVLRHPRRQYRGVEEGPWAHRARPCG